MQRRRGDWGGGGEENRLMGEGGSSRRRRRRRKKWDSVKEEEEERREEKKGGERWRGDEKGRRGVENQEGSRDLRRLYYKYKQGKRNQGRRGEAGNNKMQKHEETGRKQVERFKAEDGKRRDERKEHHHSHKKVVRRKKPVFVTQERRLKAPTLKAVMEERSSDSRLTDSRLDSRLASTNSRLDSRLASEIDSKPKLTFTDSKPDPTQVNNVSKLDSNPGLSAAEPTRSEPTRGNAKRRKSAGKVNLKQFNEHIPRAIGHDHQTRHLHLHHRHDATRRTSCTTGSWG